MASRNDEALPQAFADLIDRKLHVLNLALTGYSPQQFLREMETGRYDKVIGPDPKVFVFLTAPGTPSEPRARPTGPRTRRVYELENGSVVYRGECNAGLSLWLRDWLEDSAAYRRAVDTWRHRVSHDDVDLYVSELEAAVKMARAKYGVPTIIPYLSVPKQYLEGTGFTDELIMQRLRDAGAIVIESSLKNEEAAGHQISIRIDGHPTPYANRLRAAQIKAAIDEKCPTSCCPMRNDHAILCCELRRARCSKNRWHESSARAAL